MSIRHLYIVRHGAATPFGELTDIGRRQSELVGERLARLPIQTVWHSPLPRAAQSAQIVGTYLPDADIREQPNSSTTYRTSHTRATTPRRAHSTPKP